MPVYEKANEEVYEAMTAAMERFHPGLRDAGVMVDCIVAKGKTDPDGQPIEAAVKLHGYPCAAKVKVIGPKDRAMGRGDAEIVLDGDAWPTWSPQRRAALFDHELNHLELKVNKKGGVIRDDQDRPKLKLRLHDVQAGWFLSVAQRHGAASFEVAQAEKLFTDHGQILFPFASGTRPIEKAEAFLAGGKKGGDVESVTLSSGGRSVTLTAEHRRKADAMLKKERDRSPRGMKSIAKDLAGGAASMPPG